MRSSSPDAACGEGADDRGASISLATSSLCGTFLKQKGRFIAEANITILVVLESTLATFERCVVGCRRISDTYPDKQLTDRIEGKGNCETAVQRPWLFPISFEHFSRKGTLAPREYPSSV